MIRIFTLLFSLLPFSAFAGEAKYTLIAPIGTLSGAVTLQKYLEGAFTTIIGIAGILAVLMLVICGIKLMGTGSVSAKSEAKQCIYNAIFGLILALSSWIILNTINPMLLRSDAELAVDVPAAPPEAQSQGGVLGGGQVAPGDDPMPTEEGWYYRYKVPAGNVKNSVRFDSNEGCGSMVDAQLQTDPASVVKTCFYVEKKVGGEFVPSASMEEKAARMALCGNETCVETKTPIEINKLPCTPSRPTNCTDVKGLASISAIKTLQAECGCNIVITGGTESGPHKSHGVGKPQTDLRKLTPLGNYIKAKSKATRKTGGGSGYTQYLVSIGGVDWWFTDEGGGEPHWHICPSGYDTTWCRP